jgi:hypothetical protein
MTLTEVQSQTTQTGINTGAWLDTSAITTDWTLKINVSALSDSGSATPVVRLGFEDTANYGTAAMAGPSVSFLGKLGPSYDKVKSFKKQDYPDLRMGTAGDMLRLKMLNLEATGSVTYRAWIES